MLTHDVIPRSDVGRNAAREWLTTIQWVASPGFSRKDPMDGFTAEQARTWDTWQRANAESARRGERVARLAFAAIAAVAALATMAAAIWR